MLELKPVSFIDVQQYFVDFQKKSGVYEIPPDEARFCGIYADNQFVGYFVLVELPEGLIEINQGYLIPEMRHKGLEYTSLKTLETKLKALNYKQIILKASRSLKAYSQFMSRLGFEPKEIIFAKVI